jgi:hypothetical protein
MRHLPGSGFLKVEMILPSSDLRVTGLPVHPFGFLGLTGAGLTAEHWANSPA